MEDKKEGGITREIIEKAFEDLTEAFNVQLLTLHNQLKILEKRREIGYSLKLGDFEFSVSGNHPRKILKEDFEHYLRRFLNSKKKNGSDLFS